MKRKRIILEIGICVLVLVVGGFALWPKETEPVYQGKPLSYWAEDYAKGLERGTDIGSTARLALQSIGTNALPDLLRWIQYRPRPIQKKLAKIFRKLRVPALQRLFGGKSEVLADWYASQVFYVLGTNAVPAATELIRLMNDTTSPHVSSRAIECLAYLGPSALAPMMDALGRTNFPNRADVISDFAILKISGVDISPALPLLLQCLESQDAEISSWTAITLGQTRLKPEVSVPAIIGRMTNTLVRRECVVALGKFGATASNSLPQLILALQDPSEDVREQSTNAIRKIAPALVGTVVQPPDNAEWQEY